MTSLEKLLQAGTILSNLAFNLKQRSKDNDCWQMQLGNAQEAWDKAMTDWQKSKEETKKKQAKARKNKKR